MLMTRACLQMLLFLQLILQGQKLLSMLLLKVVSVTAQIGMLLFKLFGKPVSLGLQDALATALRYMRFGPMSLEEICTCIIIQLCWYTALC